MTYEKNYQYIKKILENKDSFLKMLDIIVEKKDDRKIYKSKLEKIFGNKKKKVLIIGNGPSVKKIKIGRLIDRSNFFVIRINNYVINNFEEYVGTRTDLWVSCLGVTQKPRNIGNIKTLTCQNCQFNVEYDVKERLKEKFLDYKNIKTDIYHITNLFKFFYIRNQANKYTTGLIILLICSMYFENNIFCYGFDFYQSGKQYYYGGISQNFAHDFAMENKIYELLVKNNWVKPLNIDENIRAFANIFTNDLLKNNSYEYLKNKPIENNNELEEQKNELVDAKNELADAKNELLKMQKMN